MYDTERIARIIGDIERYLSDLQELNIAEVSELKARDPHTNAEQAN